MNRFEKIKEWLAGCPHLDNYIFFNVIQSEVGSTSMTSDIGTAGVVEEYIDGDRLIDLTFNVEITANYDKGTSDVNMQAMEAFEKITTWVRAQNKAKNFPDFGDDVVESITDTYVNPDVYVFDNEDTKCQYVAKYTVRYLEKG